MRTLRSSDAAALLDLVAELGDLHDPLPFPPRLLASLRRLIPCDEVGYADTDPSTRRSLLHVWNDSDGGEGVIFGDGEWWCEAGQRERYWRIRDTHPICAYRFASGDWTTPCKVSDFATLRAFRRTPIYTEFIRGGANYLLHMSVVATPKQYRHIEFARVRRDFDERDRLVLALLRPHLAARLEAVAAGADGRVEALTAREREILDRVARGQQNDAIAFELGIASATVAKHLEHAYRKLGVTNRTAAAALNGRRPYELRT